MKNTKLPIKNTKQRETKVRLEHLSIVESGVRVDVLIDYKQMQVSLVDSDRTYKKYMFYERGLVYQEGWRVILEAIKVAMDLGFQKLHDRQETDKQEQMEMIVELDCALSDNK